MRERKGRAGREIKGTKKERSEGMQDRGGVCLTILKTFRRSCTIAMSAKGDQLMMRYTNLHIELTLTLTLCTICIELHAQKNAAVCPIVDSFVKCQLWRGTCCTLTQPHKRRSSSVGFLVANVIRSIIKAQRRYFRRFLCADVCTVFRVRVVTLE